MSYFLYVAKYIFFLLLFGNFVFLLTWFSTPRPKFKEDKHYSEKSIKRQQEILVNYKRMMWNRFILINFVPCVLFVVTSVVSIINNDELKKSWIQLNFFTEGMTAMICIAFLKHASHRVDYDIMPDGSVKLCKVSKICIYIMSCFSILLWIILVVLLCTDIFK